MITSGIGIGVAFAAKAGRSLLIAGVLVLVTSQAILWWLVADGSTRVTGRLPR